MFSTDQNVETIGQLVETLRNYVGLQSEYVKLDIVEKVVRLLTVATMTVIISVLLIVAAIFSSFALAHAIAPYTGVAGGFAIVAAVYLLLLVLVVVYRKRWIERPLVRFLASMLM